MNRLFAIGKVTKVSGLSGEVRVRPLVRQFDDYVEDKNLSLGFSDTIAREIKLKKSLGLGKRKRFLFEGVSSRDDAESLIGQILYAQVSEQDPILLISPDLIGASVFTVAGEFVGELVDMLTLPANDVYVIENGKKEFLIPVIPEIVKGISTTDGLVTISPMDGLLD